MAACGTPSRAALRRSISRSLRGAAAMLLSSTSTTPGVASQHGAHGACHLLPALGFRPVDLGHQRRQHRRAGRHLDQLDVGAQAPADLLQAGPQPLDDGVTLLRAMRLVQQRHLQVAHLAAAAQVVLPHQAVEVDGRSRAGIGLVVAHLGLARPGRRRARAARPPSAPAACPRACPPPPGTPTCCRRAASSG